jgi:signal transduction histidine kinase
VNSPSAGFGDREQADRDVTRQKRLEREILEITDRERERLGRELHDGVCQTLAGIAALSAALSRRLAVRSNSDASAAAAEITALLNGAIGEVRDLAHGLGPVGLQEVGLTGALEGLALAVQHRFRVACTLECEGTFSRLGHEVEAHLFRIAQEAVNNAVTHARTDRIEISLSGTDLEGRLSVMDDGVGLPDSALQGDGIGLHTMAYRARLIGGSLDVRRRTPRGTAVTCVFPLPATPDTRENLGHARTDG